MSENGPNDLRVCYKPLFNLLELIKNYFNLEELEKYESSFEWNEIVHI